MCAEAQFYSFNRLGGVMVGASTPSLNGRQFKPQPSHTETEDQEGTQISNEQRWSHQEEPGRDSGFSRYSTTLKPIQAQPSEPYSN